jgi:uncharacterized delta-60 repeat protein
LRAGIARLNPDGTLDTAFDAGTIENGCTVFSVAPQPGGKVLIGGNLNELGGWPRNYLARLDGAGGVDGAFTTDADDSVRAIALQDDGRIVVGGLFLAIGGQSRSRLARLDPDGVVESSFTPAANGKVYAVALQPDGKILIGGDFTAVNGMGRNRCARLNADGTLDEAFNPNVTGGDVRTLVLQRDGKILLGGSFSAVSGTTRYRIARLHPDGSLDAAFDPNADAYVFAVTLQADGKVLVGGTFNTIGGIGRQCLARLIADAPAEQDLAASPDGTAAAWTLGGAFPEVGDCAFEESPDGAAWTPLGAAQRTGGGWVLEGLSLPFNARRYLRGRARATADGMFNGGRSLFESVRIFYNPGETLSVAKAGNGAGTVTSDPAGIACGSACVHTFARGATVTLTAAPDGGHFFGGWAGDCAACGTNPNCDVTMSAARSCSTTFYSGGPGEASKGGSALTATKGGGTSVNVTYTPANCATDHTAYWGVGPIAGALAWTGAACGLGASGAASFDPGDPAAGSFVYFVIVGDNGSVEGSYGKHSSDTERPDTPETIECHPQQLAGACP